MTLGNRCLLLANLFTVLLWTLPAVAQNGPSGQSERGAPAERQGPVPGPGNEPNLSSGTASTGLWERSNLLGDLGGFKSLLNDKGIQFGLTEASEVFGNPTGGRAQGVIYEGLTEISLGLDLGKMEVLPGAIINISAFQIHGRGLSANNIGNLNTVSNIEAERSTRLFEWWYQQSFLDDRLDIKIGQQSADLEFITSQYAGLFINASFGWPTLAGTDLPSGGAAYPLATPAIRLRARPTEQVTALLGVFNGDPAGPGTGNPQLRDRSGTRFSLDGGVFVIGEVQYALNQGENDKGLPGTYKLGAWYNSNSFPDQLSANAPASVGNLPGARRNDWSIYGVIDQLVYRPPGAGNGGVGVFFRAMGAPGDRNQVDVFVDAGISYKGVFGRESDTVGFGVGWARISDRARAGDAAFAASQLEATPVRSSETVLELTYQTQPAPWWTVQPDIQYVFRPGGGIADPNRPAKPLGDALILGLRTSVTF